MASDRDVFETVLTGRGTVNFRDFEHLLLALGFRLARVSGSHHIYLHPLVGRPFPIQPDGRDAKRYQVRQLRDMIRLHGLTLDPNG
jgi:predicted RNA binding protein YcfA (HicA-like mRNA interferase family)